MIDEDKEVLAARLKGSFLDFCIMFFPLITGRSFINPTPIGREPHTVTLARALTRAQRLEIPNHKLIVTIPPGHFKSVMVSLWISWCYTHYPACNFLYVSYSKIVASKHTGFIKQIMTSKYFQYLFDVHIRHDSKAKDLFRTEQLGCVGAFGSASSITGQDAGLPGLDFFTGAIIIDDPIKPDEASSDTIRQSVIDNYNETISQRKRSNNVPIIVIAQRVHEDDLCNYLLTGQDGYEWESIIMKGLDDAGNALCPEVIDREGLLIKQEFSPYVFASQYQQEPVPAGGSIFKPEWFPLLDHEPKMILTFIVADTAETTASYNDATVFSFMGLYEIEHLGKKTGALALHWIDCVEMRIEPKDLESAFINFYGNCCLYPVVPQVAAIEKKSTGVTLVSVLKSLRGLSIREIERTRATGGKTQRFLEIQPYISSGRVSFTNGSKHAQMCIDHMAKITGNSSHRWDDIADTLADSVKLALIEKTLYSVNSNTNNSEHILASLNNKLQRKLQAGMIRNDPYSKKMGRKT